MFKPSILNLISRATWFLLVLICARGSFAQTQPVTLTSLLEQMSNVKNMPRFRDYTTHLADSADPTGGNKDRGQFPLGTFKNEKILARADGPGAIVRIWASNSSRGTIRIYLDNDRPVVQESFGNLFNGKYFGVQEPLSHTTSGAASYLAIPMPFQTRALITVENPDPELAYEVSTLQFPPRTAVQTFQYPLSYAEEQAIQKVSKTWNAPSIPPLSNFERTTVPPSGPCTTQTNCIIPEIARIGSASDPRSGQVNALAIKLGSGNRALRNLVLRIHFDGHLLPDVEAPLADFRGNPFEYLGDKNPLTGNVPNSLFTRASEDTFYFLMPMPFGQEMRVTLENGTQNDASIEVAYAFEAGPFDPATTGYLRSQFFHEQTKAGRAHPWMQSQGTRGHFMGIVNGYVGAQPGFGYLEGDDQFRVDNEVFHQVQTNGTTLAPWNGTGTADYFNFGITPSLKQPTYGCPLRTPELGALTAYRWHLIDGPSWRSSINAQMEHGESNNAPDTYFSSLAWWYSSGTPQRNKPILRAADLEWPKRVKGETLRSAYWFEGPSLQTTATGSPRISGSALAFSLEPKPEQHLLAAQTPPAISWPSPPPPRTDFDTGMNIHLAADQNVWTIADMGAKWVRIDMNWSIMEREKGNWNFQPFDDVILNAKSRGLKVLATLAYSPPWATADGKESSVPQIGDWQQFVTMATARYRLTVDAFSIWNEPNLDQFWTGTPEQYVDILLKPACKIIRRDAPGMTIVGPDLAHLNNDDLNQIKFHSTIKNRGGADCLDVIGHHLYANTLDELKSKLTGYTLPDGFRYRDGLLQWLKTAGLSGKPVWINEFGYNVKGDEAGMADREAEQARQLEAQVRYLHSIDWVKKVFVFEMTDGPDPASSPYQFGVLRYGGQPRPAYYRLQTLIGADYYLTAVPRKPSN